jgi:acyl carrier protein
MTAHVLLAEVVSRDLAEIENATRLAAIPGLDSLAMVNLVLRLESVLRRELTESELERLVTVGDVQHLLSAT